MLGSNAWFKFKMNVWIPWPYKEIKLTLAVKQTQLSTLRIFFPYFVTLLFVLASASLYFSIFNFYYYLFKLHC